MFTWEITHLDRRTADNFVLSANWQLSRKEGDTVKTIYGKASFSGDIKTPFEQLTEQEVLSWVWQQVSKDETEEQMTTIFVNKNVPSGLPWSIED